MELVQMTEIEESRLGERIHDLSASVAEELEVVMYRFSLRGLLTAAVVLPPMLAALWRNYHDVQLPRFEWDVIQQRYSLCWLMASLVALVMALAVKEKAVRLAAITIMLVSGVASLVNFLVLFLRAMAW